MPALTVVVSPVHREFEADIVLKPGGGDGIVVLMSTVVVEPSGSIM